MRFTDLVGALEDARGARNNTRLQKEIVRDLVARTGLKDAGRVEQLLRALMPKEDRARVYGFKTAGLMRLVAHALDKMARPDLAARMRHWLPTPCRSALTAHTTIVCMPEIDIASILGRIKGAAAGGGVTLEDIGKFCDGLVGSEDSARTEALVHMVQSQGLSGDEWALLVRMLFKTVSLGIGRETVLEALPLPAAAAMYARQRSLSALANAVVNEDTRVQIVCGTPFTPMACDALKTPYLLPWIFSREEQLQHPISPNDGRLVVVTDRSTPAFKERWYAPLSSAFKMRMVNIDDDRDRKSVV